MLYGELGFQGVTLSCFGLVTIWFLVAVGLKQPDQFRSVVLRIDSGSDYEGIAARLREIRGVAEAVVVPEDGVAYLKVSAGQLDSDTLDTLAADPNIKLK